MSDVNNSTNINNIGILDPLGNFNNPLNNKPYSEKYKKLADFWRKLPVYSISNEIIKDIIENQVLLMISETGSGKSVIIPKLALHTLNYNGKVAMTLPKQIITKSAAEFGAETLDVVMGEEVGYKYKGSPKNAFSDKTKLLYATHGTILSKCLKDPLLKEFDIVILDESHERAIEVDFLIYLLREVIKKRKEFKLILMSATINISIFENYFMDFKFKKIELPGERKFPITSHFLEKTLNYDDILKKGFDILIELIKDKNYKTETNNDIIFFVTSSNESFMLCKMLNDYLTKHNDNNCKIVCQDEIFCVEVFSGMDITRQTLAQDKNLFKENTNFKRKIVISTPVAESSLTIDGIKYVIDSGYELSGSFDPDYRARRLDKILITNAQAKQRMGRSGRTSPGICYHLYTKDEFENQMKKFPDPDIRISDITFECLKLLNINNINNIDNLISTLSNFIEPPKESFIKLAVNNLIQLGLVENNEITELGKIITEIPENNIMMAIAIFFSKIYNCSWEVIKIAGMIDASKGNLNEIYKLPDMLLNNEKFSVDDKSKNQIDYLNSKLNDYRKKFMSTYGDHISLLNIFESYKEMISKTKNNKDKINQWCYDNFLKLTTLNKADKYYHKMTNIVNKLSGKINLNNLANLDKLNINYYDDIAQLKLEDRIVSCLVIGFRLYSGVKKNDLDFYKTQYSKDLRIKINKMSFLNFKNKLPKNILYHELFISMGRSELNIVSKIPKKVIKILK